MQTALIKYDIISWVTGLTDERLIHQLHQLAVEQNRTKESTSRVASPKRKGSLSEGYGFWADDAPFDENSYRDKLWQTGKSAW